jgi:hypothetical protein
MQWNRVSVVGVSLVLLTAGVSGQQPVSPGIAAFLGGDYETAARLLTPAAEGSATPDPVAQFLLATLYDSGRGVPRNPLRACGLYMAASTVPSPIATQAGEIAAVLKEPFFGARGPMATCASANTTPWGEPQPAFVTLGPGHWLRVDATGIVVGFNGGERRRTNAMFGGPGMRFLPIRYTRLDVHSPEVGRRHFIEWFDWHQLTPDVARWALGWMLDEIVGDEMFNLAGEPALTTSEAATPPMSIDVSRLVQLRVNAAGEAEWVISDPANPRTAVIPQRTR